MKKKVKVKTHTRDGVVVDAHERVVDEVEVETLTNKIKNDKNQRDMANLLFSFVGEEENK